MKIPLIEFELHVPEKVLLLGLKYFQKDKVLSAEAVELGHQRFEVQGTELYEVDLHIKNDHVVKVACTCMAVLNMCIYKHAAAVMFFLQQDRFRDLIPDKIDKSKPKRIKSMDLDEMADSAKSKSKKPGKTIESELIKLLERVGDEELRNFMVGHAKKDKNFRTVLQMHFMHHSDDTSLKKFRSDVKLIIRSASKGDGYRAWTAVYRMIKPLTTLMDQSDRLDEMGDHDAALHLRLALVIEIMPVFLHSDDSGGVLSALWDRVYTSIEEFVLRQEFTGSQMQLIYDTCLKEAHQGLGFDFGYRLLDLARILINDEKRRKAFESTLDQIILKDESGYQTTDMMKLKLRLHLDLDGEKTTWDFAMKNRVHFILRDYLLSIHEKEQNWQQYLALAREGSEQPKSGYIDPKGKYQDHIIKALEKLGDTDLAREMKAESFFDKRMRIEQWIKIKKLFTAKEWAKVREKYLNHAITKYEAGTHFKLSVYVHEGMKEEFIAEMKRNQHENYIRSFAVEVRQWMPDLYYKVYFNDLRKMVNQRIMTDERFYSNMAALLRNLSPLMKGDDLKILKLEAEINCGKKRHFQNLVMPVFEELGIKH